MAAKFHINDAGVAGACHAKEKCPFGDLTEDHYESREQAQAAYEQKMEKAAEFAKTPLGKLDSKVKDLAARFKSKAKAVNDWSNAHIIKSTSFALAASAAVGAATAAIATGDPSMTALGGMSGTILGSGVLAVQTITSDKVSRWLANRREARVYDKIAAETGKDFRDENTRQADLSGAVRARQIAMDARYGTNVARGATA